MKLEILIFSLFISYSKCSIIKYVQEHQFSNCCDPSNPCKPYCCDERNESSEPHKAILPDLERQIIKDKQENGKKEGDGKDDKSKDEKDGKDDKKTKMIKKAKMIK
ncbi:hypothetical protein EDEG_00289, partial [Edhazardia aedis USNM 41457]